MAWQCPDDGTFNSGPRCPVCGRPRLASVPRLCGAEGDFTVPTNGLVLGSADWPDLSIPGLSRQHLRVFVDQDLGVWVVTNLSRSGDLAVNGLAIRPGERHPIKGGEIIRLAGAIELLVDISDSPSAFG
jgi:hypothetical protein